MERTQSVLEKPGAFVVGCNYWASHAGTRMWSTWKPSVVNRDLKKLADAGLQVLRVFPLWPDFQPIMALRGGHGHLREIRLVGEIPLPGDAVGQAGVSSVMLDRFDEFCALAAKHRLQLIVGLVTGWMSGRMFVPPAFEYVNVITDPVALMWQTRLVRTLVQRHRSQPAIVAWDLGNECNCMAGVPGREAAWSWTALMANTIRSVDQSRPVVSGMHSLMPTPDHAGGWTIQDQAENTDLLTTHPYPMWCRHTAQDPIDTMRTTLHAVAETRMYADIGGKPCIAEEIGTMGPAMGDWDVASAFVRTTLYSLWANDCHGFMWWCGFDQMNLSHAPYDWVGVERELGLFRENGTAKPMLAEMTQFRRFLDRLPFDNLPPRRAEAVCVLTRGQDQWAVAYATLVLAKQAGFDVEFQYVDQPLEDARLYLLPSVSGIEPVSRHVWLELLDRAKAGAGLYVSLNDGALSPFTDVFGVRVKSRAWRTSSSSFSMGSGPASITLTARQGVDLRIVADGSETLGATSDGNAVFTSRRYGSGRVWLLAFPMEQQLTGTPGGFHAEGAEPYWRIYRDISVSVTKARILRKNSPMLAVTEHRLAKGRVIAVIVNHATGRINEVLRVATGWRLAKSHRGSVEGQGGELHVVLPGNDAVVVELRRV